MGMAKYVEDNNRIVEERFLMREAYRPKLAGGNGNMQNGFRYPGNYSSWRTDREPYDYRTM